MALQHRDEIEMMKTSLTLREKEVRRLKREVKIVREGQKKAADREAAARVQKDAALDMAEELKKAAVAARRDRNVMASNCKRDKKRMAAVLKDTARKCDAAIDQLKKQYVGAIDELEGAGCSAEEHFTNCKAEGKGRPYTYEFERLSRAALASGASANSCRDMLQIHSNYLIRGEKGADIYLPHKRWYSKQREAKVK